MSTKTSKMINGIIESIKEAQKSPYGARVFDATQVITIMNDLLAVSDSEKTGDSVTITEDMVKELIDNLKRAVGSSCDHLRSEDVVDENSLELQISGGEVEINNIDIDQDHISDVACEDIESTISEWLDENDIEVTK